MAISFRQPALPYVVLAVPTALWAALLLTGDGITDASLLELTRLTARTSVFFFLAAFTASALFRLTRSAPARFLVVNRRHIGLAFALAHFIHLGALTAYLLVSGEERGLVSLVGGGLAYLLIGAMAVTSNNTAQRRLGRNWRRLHLVGAWYVWLIFLNSYLGRVLEGRDPPWLFGAITGLLLAAASLRVAVGVREWFRGQVSG